MHTNFQKVVQHEYMNLKEQSSKRPAWYKSGEKCVQRTSVRIIVVLLLVICICITILKYFQNTTVKSAYSNTKVIFIYRDAGESYGLTPLFNALSLHTTQENEAMTIIIPFGTNPYWKDMFIEKKKRKNYVLLNSILPNCTLCNTWSNRNVQLSKMDVMHFFRQFPSLQTIVTGLVSNIQTNIVQYANEKNIRTIGFDDGFGLSEWGNVTSKLLPTWSTVCNVQNGYLSELWVTSTIIQHAIFQSNAYQKSIQKPIVVATGTPTIQKWLNQLKLSSNRIKVAQWQEKMILVPNNKTWMHIFGGYNSIHSTDYGDTIDMVAKSISGYWGSNTTVKPVITFSPHPGNFSTSYEQSIFQKHKVNLIVIDNVEPYILAKGANITLSHYSSTGIQSFIIGKNAHSFFFLPFTNVR
jgi:hypothetical protein